MQTKRWWRLMAVASLVLAGCATSRRVHGQPARAGVARPVRRAETCPGAAKLVDGIPVPGWRMGALTFVSPVKGVGLTAPEVVCTRPVAGGGFEDVLHPAAVRLAVTGDGGRTWVPVGRPLPFVSVEQTGIVERIATRAPGGVWALLPTGAVYATSSGGDAWRRVSLPQPVIDLQARGGVIWALSCQPVHETVCRPTLARSSETTGRWTEIPVPRDPYFVQPRMAVLGARGVVVSVGRYPNDDSELLWTGDGGRSWRSERPPVWDGHRCLGSSWLTTAGARHWWLLCLFGAAAAGHSTKALFETSNAGRTWRRLSAVRSLVAPPAPNAISSSEPNALAAGASTRLWFALQNELSESLDGGRTWSYVPGVNPQGFPAQIDVLCASRAWLLVPNGGLWRTTDGRHWQRVGPLSNPLFG